MRNDSGIRDYLEKNFIKVDMDVSKEKENLIYQEFGEWHLFLIIPGVKFEQPVHVKFQAAETDGASDKSNLLSAVDDCIERVLPIVRTAAGSGNEWARNYLKSKGRDW